FRNDLDRSEKAKSSAFANKFSAIRSSKSLDDKIVFKMREAVIDCPDNLRVEFTEVIRSIYNSNFAETNIAKGLHHPNGIIKIHVQIFLRELDKLVDIERGSRS
ncbi:MAG: hypothetical protein AB1847_23170, partial [bacterium]